MYLRLDGIWDNVLIEVETETRWKDVWNAQRNPQKSNDFYDHFCPCFSHHHQNKPTYSPLPSRPLHLSPRLNTTSTKFPIIAPYLRQGLSPPPQPTKPKTPTTQQHTHKMPLQNAEIRTTLLQRLSHAQQTLDHALIGKTALQILRFYIKDGHFSQANSFIQNTAFPQADQVDSQTFGYLTYYIALVKTVFLEYDDALDLLNLVARGHEEQITPFHIHVFHLYVVVSLLIGSIPDRGIFSLPLVTNNMNPVYLELTQAVRRGEVAEYNRIITNQANIDSFVSDNTYNLILRLPPTIVRAGLKRAISVYSTITLAKLGEVVHIPAADVHSIVAKAIADGVIKAYIDDNNVVHSENVVPNYSSTQPQVELAQRISTVINLKQQCQQSLRYPDRQQSLTTDEKGGAVEFL